MDNLLIFLFVFCFYLKYLESSGKQPLSCESASSILGRREDEIPDDTGWDGLTKLDYIPWKKKRDSKVHESRPQSSPSFQLLLYLDGTVDVDPSECRSPGGTPSDKILGHFGGLLGRRCGERSADGCSVAVLLLAAEGSQDLGCAAGGHQSQGPEERETRRGNWKRISHLLTSSPLSFSFH